LPSQIRSRARNRFIKIDPAGAIESTILLFKQVFSEHVLSPVCNQAFLIHFLTPLHEDGWRIRDFESLLESAVAIARRTDKISPRLSITPTQLQEALKGIQRTDTDSKYGTEAESEEERYHKENLTQQKALHQDTKTMQQAQFVQGLFINKKVNSDQKSKGTNLGFSGGTGGFNVSGGWSDGVNNISKDDKCITDYLSEEQIGLHCKQQQERAQREAGQARVRRDLKHLALTTSTCKEMLLSINVSGAQFLGRRSLLFIVNRITKSTEQLSHDFERIQIPSREELDNFNQKISKLNTAADMLRSKIEMLAKAVDANKLFESFAIKASEYRQKLVPVYSASPRLYTSNEHSLVLAIDQMAQRAKGLSDIFKNIQIPSQEELNAFTQEITQLSRSIEWLFPTIEPM
jgi:hypothetical protein